MAESYTLEVTMTNVMQTRVTATTNPTTPTRTYPTTTPRPQPEPIRRYQPDPDHCPGQRVRTVRRVRRVIEP